MKEEKIKALLSESLIQASEHFEDRVMTQIVTEASLKPMVSKASYSDYSYTLSLFLKFMTLIVILGGIVSLKFVFNQEINQNRIYYLLIAGIVFSVFFSLSMFDDYRMAKTKK
jgi:K+-sensing histidine kinase KdpD